MGTRATSRCSRTTDALIDNSDREDLSFTMIEITQHAASVIATECAVREVPDSGGLRIAPKSAVHNGTPRSLVIEFVPRPQPSDIVVREGDATVFLADGVDHLVGERVLDTEDGEARPGGGPPRLVLRARPAAT